MLKVELILISGCAKKPPPDDPVMLVTRCVMDQQDVGPRNIELFHEFSPTTKCTVIQPLALYITY